MYCTCCGSHTDLMQLSWVFGFDNWFVVLRWGVPPASVLCLAGHYHGNQSPYTWPHLIYRMALTSHKQGWYTLCYLTWQWPRLSSVLGFPELTCLWCWVKFPPPGQFSISIVVSLWLHFQLCTASVCVWSGGKSPNSSFTLTHLLGFSACFF